MSGNVFNITAKLPTAPDIFDDPPVLVRALSIAVQIQRLKDLAETTRRYNLHNSDKLTTAEVRDRLINNINDYIDAYLEDAPFTDLEIDRHNYLRSIGWITR